MGAKGFMTTVTVPQAQPNDELTDELINQGPNAIADVVNGNLDDANISSLTGSKIASGTLPAAAMTADTNPETRMAETLANSIASGCVWSALTGLNGAMTAGVAYVNGKRLTITAIASYTFTASRDTYVYLSSTGSAQYVPVTLNAAQPATPADHVLVAKVITSASAVTSVVAMPGRPVTNAQIYDEYSLTETVTGKRWINGKPIYRKVVDFGPMPNAAVKNIGHGITGVTQFTDVFMITRDGAQHAPIPWSAIAAAGSSIQMNVNSTSISVATSHNYASFSVTYVVLEYIK